VKKEILNNYNKGLNAELWYSQIIHEKEIPFLISTRFLKILKIKQIDIAYCEKDLMGIVLLEIKSRSQIGDGISHPFTTLEIQKWKKTKWILQIILKSKITVKFISLIKNHSGNYFVKNSELV